MKYIRTAISEQETTINILYDEQVIIVYSSRSEIIKILTQQLGNPTIKYKKNKSYWSGARWDIEFNDLKKIEKILLFKSFVDSGIEIKEKINKLSKNKVKTSTVKSGKKQQKTKKKLVKTGVKQSAKIKEMDVKNKNKVNKKDNDILKKKKNADINKKISENFKIKRETTNKKLDKNIKEYEQVSLI